MITRYKGSKLTSIILVDHLKQAAFLSVHLHCLLDSQTSQFLSKSECRWENNTDTYILQLIEEVTQLSQFRANITRTIQCLRHERQPCKSFCTSVNVRLFSVGCQISLFSIQRIEFCFQFKGFLYCYSFVLINQPVVN